MNCVLPELRSEVQWTYSYIYACRSGQRQSPFEATVANAYLHCVILLQLHVAACDWPSILEMLDVCHKALNLQAEGEVCAAGQSVVQRMIRLHTPHLLHL